MPRAGYLPVVGAPHLIVLLLSTPPAALPEANTSRNQLADTSINCASESRASPRLHKEKDTGSAIHHFNQVFLDWCDVHDSLNRGVTGYLSTDLFRPHLPLLLFLRRTVHWKMREFIRLSREKQAVAVTKESLLQPVPLLTLISLVFTLQGHIPAPYCRSSSAGWPEKTQLHWIFAERTKTRQMDAKNRWVGGTSDWFHPVCKDLKGK